LRCFSTDKGQEYTHCHVVFHELLLLHTLQICAAFRAAAIQSQGRSQAVANLIEFERNSSQRAFGRDLSRDMVSDLERALRRCAWNRVTLFCKVHAAAIPHLYTPVVPIDSHHIDSYLSLSLSIFCCFGGFIRFYSIVFACGILIDQAREHVEPCRVRGLAGSFWMCDVGMMMMVAHSKLPSIASRSSCYCMYRRNRSARSSAISPSFMWKRPPMRSMHCAAEIPNLTWPPIVR